MGNVTGKDETEESGELDEGDDDVEDPSVTSSEHGFPPVVTGHVRRTRDAGSPPASPGQQRSPRMFVPQTPVSPLQKLIHPTKLMHPTPIFNQILAYEEQDYLDYPPEKEIPVLLVWTLGGKNVSVEGSWDHWKTRRAMQKSGKDFSILLALPSGIYRYQFIVDGERKYIPDFPNITDETGHIVNLLDVHDHVPENVESVSGFESPPSPVSSYGCVQPDDKEYSKDPPVVPPQLPSAFLGTCNSDENFSKPQHIVLNHLFIERGWGAQPIVALGLTHRFQSKYVTLVLYKPVER